jgi:hypothetical protein
VSIIAPASRDASDLPRGSRLELYRQLNRHAPRWATMVFHVYAFVPGPSRGLRCCSARSQEAPRSSALAGGSAPTREPQPRSAARKRVWQRPGMLGVQVDHTPCRAGELDGIVSLAAVKVMDEQRLYLLGRHVCSVPVSGLGRSSIPHRLDG